MDACAWYSVRTYLELMHKQDAVRQIQLIQALRVQGDDLRDHVDRLMQVAHPPEEMASDPRAVEAKALRGMAAMARTMGQSAEATRAIKRAEYLEWELQQGEEHG